MKKHKNINKLIKLIIILFYDIIFISKKGLIQLEQILHIKWYG